MAQGSIIQKIQTLDEIGVRYSQRLHFRPVTFVMLAASYSGYGTAWVSLVVLMSYLKHSETILFVQQRLMHESMFAALIAWSTGYIIKKTIKRPRPQDTMAEFQATDKTRLDPSFPSNHAAAAIAWALALILTGHPYAWGISIWAVLVTFSRYYLGVHYPSDILGGAVLGSLCGVSVGIWLS